MDLKMKCCLSKIIANICIARSRLNIFESFSYYLVAGIATLFLFVPDLHARTILVFEGYTRGGSGDIVANLNMAFMLKAASPKDRVVYIYTDNSHKAFDLNFRSEWEPIVRGVEFREISKPFSSERSYECQATEEWIKSLDPKKTVSLNFSYFAGQLPHNPDLHIDNLKNIPLFTINEFHGKEATPLKQLTGNEYIDNKNLFHVSAGLESNLGIYTLPFDFYKHLPNRNKTIKLVSRKLGLPFVPKANSLIGYAYVNTEESAEQYIRLIEEYARRKPLEDYHIFINHKLDDATSNRLKELPQIFVHSYERISLELSESLIRYSDLPVAVTGDNSLTFAIQHKKIFLYEALRWKWNFADHLVAELNKHLNTNIEKEVVYAPNSVLTKYLDDLSKESTNREYFGSLLSNYKRYSKQNETDSETRAKAMYNLFVDRKSQMEMALEKIRNANSLPTKLLDLFKLWDQTVASGQMSPQDFIAKSRIKKVYDPLPKETQTNSCIRSLTEKLWKVVDG
jgi:hypothetical protein